MDAASERIAPKHSWVWLLVLVVGGALGIYIAAPATAVLHSAWTRLADVPLAAIAIVAGGALGVVATEALRIAVIGRIAGTRVGARNAWDAAVANHVMTAVTPQVGLGEPTVAYTLAKRGVPWDAAVAIPFVKFTTSLALVFALGAVLVALGYGPPIEPWMTRAAIVWFGVIAAITIVVIVVCSSEPIGTRWIARIAGWFARRRVFASEAWQGRIGRTRDVALRTVARLARVRGANRVGDDRVSDDRVADDRVADDRVADDRVADDRVADDRVADGRVADDRVADDRHVSPVDDRAERRVDDFPASDGRAGSAADDRVADDRISSGYSSRPSPWLALLALVAVHLVYYASYIAPLVGLALVLGDPPLVTLCLRALVYLCFVFAMPTPGGVGPSEAAAAWFFGDLVAPADAIVIVVVFRASTFYLQLAIGALYLPIRSLAR